MPVCFLGPNPSNVPRSHTSKQGTFPPKALYKVRTVGVQGFATLAGTELTGITRIGV